MQSSVMCDASNTMFQKWSAELLARGSSRRNKNIQWPPFEARSVWHKSPVAWPAKPLVREHQLGSSDSCSRFPLAGSVNYCETHGLQQVKCTCEREQEDMKARGTSPPQRQRCDRQPGCTPDTLLGYIFLIKQDFRNLIPEDFIMSAYGFGFSVPFQMIIDKQPAFLYIFLSCRILRKEQKQLHYFFT